MEKMQSLMVSGTEVEGNWQCRWNLHRQEEDVEKVGIKNKGKREEVKFRIEDAEKEKVLQQGQWKNRWIKASH